MIAKRNDDFPLPIGPITDTSSPFLMVKSMSYITGVLLRRSSVCQNAANVSIETRVSEDDSKIVGGWRESIFFI